MDFKTIDDMWISVLITITDSYLIYIKTLLLSMFNEIINLYIVYVSQILKKKYMLLAI